MYYYTKLLLILVYSGSFLVNLANSLEKCCDEILISSSGPGAKYQNDRLGVYKKLPNREFNGKPLYRKVNGDDYLYFWKYTDPDNDFGHNWIVSQNYRQADHGIESPNMEYEEKKCKSNKNITTACPWTCVEHINALGVPFSVWTRLHRLGGFWRDTTLRIQCWSTRIDENCCNNLVLRSNGIGNTIQNDRLGYFSHQGQTKNGRKVYVREQNGQQNQYLYFWDWGPNNGANWFIGLDPQLKPRGIESPGLEESLYESICAPTSQLVGPFRVWDKLFDRWEVDNTLRMECYDSLIECCEEVSVTSYGSLKYYQPKTLEKYTKFDEKNNRIVYKHNTKETYLHYNDFGILEGTNWMLSNSPNDTVGLAVSQDLEQSGYESNCVTTSESRGPWLVLSQHGWQFDKTLHIECSTVI